MYRFFLLGVMIVGSSNTIAQFTSPASFEFLSIPQHARLAGLSGVNVSYANKDQNFLFSNPALVGDTLSGMFSANYLFHVADIGQATFVATKTFNKVGTISFGIQHINYGQIEAYDATGAPAGTFNSGETALVISKSHQLSNFRLGINMKTVFSNLAGFRASALIFDLGGVFLHPTQDLTIGLVLKNLGFRLSDYSETSTSKLPFDVQAGVTYKPEHMPVRFSVTTYNLATPGDLFDDSNAEDTSGTLDKVMRHFTFGAEILFHRSVHGLIGYNFLRQTELKAASGGGGSGFSYGIMVKVKTFDFGISSSRYSIGNSNYTFSVAANMDRLIFKRTVL